MITLSSQAILSSARFVQDTLLHARLDAMLLAWRQDTPLRTNLHASSVLVPATDWCSRAHVLALCHPNEIEYPEDGNSPRLNAIFLNGWNIHIKWQSLFKKYAPVVRRGHEYCLDLPHYSQQYELYYSPDAILEYANRWHVVEIKGINTDEYRAACDLPLEEAVKASETVKKARVQVTLYMHLLGITDGMVLAEDKNTQAFRAWSLGYDEKLITPYLERLNKYAEEKRDYIVDAVLPSRHKLCKSSTSARARRCPMASFCFEKAGV